MSALPRTGLSTSAAIAPVERRVDAIQAVLDERGMKPAEFIETADASGRGAMGAGERRARRRQGVDRSGVPRAPARRRQAPRSPSSASTMPRHHRHLVVLENTPAVHNVICCTLCSCTAFTIIGLPPDWYKDLEYRARVVRESRTVLQRDGPRPAAPRSRSGSGTRPPTRATWCCRCSPPDTDRLARGAAGGDRHARFDDRRRAPLSRTTDAWTASTTSAAGRASARSATRPTRRPSTRRGRSASTRSTRSRCGSASSTWTSTATRSSAWSRATTCRRATTSAR